MFIPCPPTSPQACLRIMESQRWKVSIWALVVFHFSFLTLRRSEVNLWGLKQKYKWRGGRGEIEKDEGGAKSKIRSMWQNQRVVLRILLASGWNKMKATGKLDCGRGRDGESMGWVPERVLWQEENPPRKMSSSLIILSASTNTGWKRGKKENKQKRKEKKAKWVKGERNGRKEGWQLPKSAIPLMFLLTRPISIILFQKSLRVGYDYNLVYCG